MSARPRIVGDASLLPTRRWFIHHQGHVYPFATWPRALAAASAPGFLCRYACVCSVLATPPPAEATR